MPAAVIDFFCRIVQQEPAQRVVPDDWLTSVMAPAMRHLQTFQDQTVERLQLILELVDIADAPAARRNWDALIAAHERLAVPLREFLVYVSASGHEDLIDLTLKLQRFFQLGPAESPNSDIEQALRPTIMAAISELVDRDRSAAAAVISAEILHIQLKWAILHNDYQGLESAESAS